ncbi:MAG: hypothetical protein MZU95_07850 [Desulfomicrobium escambiense]|nr:hypothetical protein [Desulfomicrobium escambiense]
MTRLLRMHANKSEPIDEVEAGRHRGDRGHEGRPDRGHRSAPRAGPCSSSRCTSPSR